MFEAAFAQTLLSLFTARDRAESIIGDLTEDSRSRGRIWFFLQVSGTASALCLKSVVSAPWRSLGLGTAAFVLWLAVYLALAGLTGMLGMLQYYPGYLEMSLTTAPPGFWVRVVLVVVGANFLTGLILGRWSASSAMSSSAPLVVLWLASWVAWPFLAKFLYSFSWYWIVAGALTFPFFYLIPLLAGSMLARR
jgi:hypothetical protein